MSGSGMYVLYTVSWPGSSFLALNVLFLYDVY